MKGRRTRTAMLRSQSLILCKMLVTRAATTDDAILIAAHRRAMFADIPDSQDADLDTMTCNFEPWVARMIAADRYAGWIVSEAERPIASAGLFILDWPPHPFDPQGEQRGYVLNVYVEPQYRRRGLAHDLTEMCMAEAQRRGIRVITLHASDAGRPIYEGMGFKASKEMMYLKPAETV
jgi:ribosomal protein S18 acetylase RimI-like enzyme